MYSIPPDCYLVSNKAWNERALETYKQLFPEDADEQTREHIWKPIQDWYDETLVGGGSKSLKSINNRIEEAKDQFASLVSIHLFIGLFLINLLLTLGSSLSPTRRY